VKSALLVIDMINDFLEKGAVLEVPMGRDIISKIIKKIKTADDLKQKIIFVCDVHEKNDKEFKYWPPHALFNTDGALIPDEIRFSIVISDIVHSRAQWVNKHTYSGFFHTKLDALLKYEKIEKVFITGILTNICVFITAIEAQMRGYETYVYRDGVAALSQEANDRALEQLEKTFKIKVV